MFPLMLARRGHRVTTLTLRGAIGYLPHHPHSSFLHRTSRANAATSALPRSLGIPGAAVPLVDPVSAQRRPHNAGGGDRRPCTPTRPTQNASDRDSPSTTKRARKTSPTATAQREQKADEVHPNKGARGQSPSLRQTPTSPSGPKHGSSRQINERIVNCGSTADLKRYLGGVPVGRLSDVNLATAVTRLAKLRRAAPRLRSRSTDGGQISDGLIADVLNRLVPRATERVGRMEAQALANMVHSLGVLVELNPRVVAQLLLRLDAGDTPPAVAEMGPQELATTMWGYARLRRGVATGSRGQPSAELVQAVTRRAEVLMSTSDSPDQSSNTKAEFDQQNLANLLWAYGALRSRPSEDLLRAAETVIRRPGFAQTLTEQSLSSMLWALGSLGAPLNPLALETLIQRGLELSGSLSGQSVANIVWALAKLGCSLQSLDPALLYALAARAVQVRRELKTQEVANIQWGFARLGARLSNRQLEQLEARYVELTQSSAAGSIASAVSTIADTLVFGDRGGSGGRKEGAADTGARRQTREELGGALGARPEEVVALMWSYAMLAEPVQQRRPELYVTCFHFLGFNLSWSVLLLRPETVQFPLIRAAVACDYLPSDGQSSFSFCVLAHSTTRQISAPQHKNLGAMPCHVARRALSCALGVGGDGYPARR